MGLGYMGTAGVFWGETEGERVLNSCLGSLGCLSTASGGLTNGCCLVSYLLAAMLSARVLSAPSVSQNLRSALCRESV